MSRCPRSWPGRAAFPDATLDIISQAARALDAAHQAGIVHRDIKPGNLLVAAGGATKITDFGIATAVAAAQASHLTETGMVMGTAMYVSPEQATGGQVTDSSDIYSLGVVGYECLAGHPPFTASEPLAIAFAHKHEPVPALPPDVPQPVSDLVYHMLAKTPEERPASVRVVADRADVLRDALALGESADSAEYLGATRADLPPAATGALLGAEGPGSRRPRGSDSGRPGRRRQLVTVASTAVLCAAAVATGLYLSSHSTDQTSGNTGGTARQLNSPSVRPSARTASPHPSPHFSPTPTPSSVVVVQPPSPPSPTVGNPKPTKSVIKPTSSPTTSQSASPSASASSSPTSTSSASPTPTSPTPSSSSSTP